MLLASPSFCTQILHVRTFFSQFLQIFTEEKSQGVKLEIQRNKFKY
jgi:hypothetical protein